MAIFDDEFPLMPEREAGLPEWCAPVMVAFALYPILNPSKTKLQGMEVYDEMPHIKIAVPFDQKTVVLQPADNSHKKRFPKAWQAFLDREKTPQTGLPLSQWAGVSRSLVLNLKANHVYTVEALSHLEESQLGNIGGASQKTMLELRDKARAFLAVARDSAAAMQLQSEKQALEDRLAAMQLQMTDLANKLAASDAGGKGKGSKAA